MRDPMIIADLPCLEDMNCPGITGGDVYTVAYTSASYRSTFAYSNASAYGQQTSTDTNARIGTQNYSSAYFSYALASATAYAYNGMNEKSSYRSTSIYYAGY